MLWTVRETLDSNEPWGAKERNDDDEVSENVHPSHQDAFFFLVRMSTGRSVQKCEHLLTNRLVCSPQLVLASKISREEITFLQGQGSWIPALYHL